MFIEDLTMPHHYDSDWDYYDSLKPKNPQEDECDDEE